MLRRKGKKWLCGLIVSLCLIGSAMPVMAETVPFDITVPGDIISKRSVKADSEQRFYVTGTSFNKGGYLYCVSSRMHTTVTSNTATISSGNPASNATYKSYAAPRYDYFMTCSASTSGLHVLGRYTP